MIAYWEGRVVMSLARLPVDPLRVEETGHRVEAKRRGSHVDLVFHHIKGVWWRPRRFRVAFPGLSCRAGAFHPFGGGWYDLFRTQRRRRHTKKPQSYTDRCRPCVRQALTAKCPPYRRRGPSSTPISRLLPMAPGPMPSGLLIHTIPVAANRCSRTTAPPISGFGT